MTEQRKATGEHGPTKPPRPRADTSDVHAATPVVTPIPGAPEWVRMLQAQQAQSEGRMMAEIVAVEKRIEVRRESKELAEMSAQLTTAERSIQRSRKTRKGLTWATVTSSFGGTLAVVALLARACGQQEIAEAAIDVAAQTAEQTAEQKAAELERKHAATVERVRDNEARIDGVERKLDRVLELLEPPTKLEVTTKKGKHPR